MTTIAVSLVPVFRAKLQPQEDHRGNLCACYAQSKTRSSHDPASRLYPPAVPVRCGYWLNLDCLPDQKESQPMETTSLLAVIAFVGAALFGAGCAWFSGKDVR
jgi:hypothetical protein